VTNHGENVPEGEMRLAFDPSAENTASATFHFGFFRTIQQIGGQVLAVRVLRADEQRPVVHLEVMCVEDDRQDYTRTFRLAVRLRRDVARALAEVILQNDDAWISTGDWEAAWLGHAKRGRNTR